VHVFIYVFTVQNDSGAPLCLFCTNPEDYTPHMRLYQRFLTFLVPRSLDKISKVVATHSNKFDFFTPIHHSLSNYCNQYDAFVSHHA